MKELMVGAGVAAAMGLYLGNLAQPRLALDAPARMQPAMAVFTDWSESAPAAPASQAADHVAASDWRPQKQALAVQSHDTPMPTADDIEWAYEERAFAESAAPLPEAPPPAPATYPSVAGDILAGTHRTEAPAAADPSPDV
jgi:hypothetical protein